MGMPPKDVPPSELWHALTQRPRPTTTIEFPTKSGVIGRTKIQVLTEAELHECRRDARVEANLLAPDSKPGDTAWEDIYRNELMVQLVCRACRAIEDPTGKVPTFPSPKAAKQILVSDEWAALFMAYSTFRAESGPMLSELTPIEMEAWIRVLQEGGSAAPLSRMNEDATRQLVLHLVSKLKTSSTVNGSPGSPQDDSSPTTTENSNDRA